MRIVSLVPNGTEILFALGAGDLVVGVSHECDYPAAARAKPRLTGTALTPGLSAGEVDRAVSDQLSQGESLYTLDEQKIAALAPDFIVTQELCPVCAVSTTQVGSAIDPLPRCPEVISLDPRTLSDVFDDILTLGQRLGRADRARELVVSLEARLARVRKTAGDRPRPGVAALEWLDPPFTAGHWVPEMIDIAGGRDLFGQPGGASRRTTWEEIRKTDPDLLIAMPCGFDKEGAGREMAKLQELEDWTEIGAVRRGRAYAVDANGCFSRPGPRLVDGVERLAALLCRA